MRKQSPLAIFSSEYYGATRSCEYSVPRYRETIAARQETLLLRRNKIFCNRNWTSIISPQCRLRRKNSFELNSSPRRSRRRRMAQILVKRLARAITLFREVFPRSVPRNLESGIRKAKGKQIVWKDETVLMDSQKASEITWRKERWVK